MRMPTIRIDDEVYERLKAGAERLWTRPTRCCAACSSWTRRASVTVKRGADSG
jgi:hypothetical protein